MVWVRRDDRWHGGWVWEAYDRDEEWDGGVNRQWLDMRNVHQPTTLPSRGVDVPVEVLRYMLEAFDWVCATVSLTTQGSHFLIFDRSNGLRFIALRRRQDDSIALIQETRARTVSPRWFDSETCGTSPVSFNP